MGRIRLEWLLGVAAASLLFAAFVLPEVSLGGTWPLVVAALGLAIAVNERSKRRSVTIAPARPAPRRRRVLDLRSEEDTTIRIPESDPARR